MKRRRRASTANLVALIVVLLMCIWLLYKLFIGIPPAKPPVVKVAGVADTGAVVQTREHV